MIVVVVVVVALTTATVATISSHATEQRRRTTERASQKSRQSVHDPVLIGILKTNAMGRCSTTTSTVVFVTHSCQWSFVAMVGVVVAVAFGEFIIVADSVVFVSFRSVLVLSSVCTSSVWNPVKRIFRGSGCDASRYLCLSRHNQAPSTTTTSTSITTRREHLDSLGASCPSISLRPSLSWTLCRLSLALYRHLLHQPDTLPDHQSVCVIPDVCFQRVVWMTRNATFRTIVVVVKTQTTGPRMTTGNVCRFMCIDKSKSHDKLDPTSYLGLFKSAV